MVMALLSMAILARAKMSTAMTKYMAIIPMRLNLILDMRLK